MSSSPDSASSQSDRVDAIIDAVRQVELTQKSAWSDLDALSSQTTVDTIEVEPAGIVFEGQDRFRGLLNVYVELNYGPDSEDEGFTTSDAFQGFFTGHFESGSVVVDDVTVDTSSFFE